MISASFMPAWSWRRSATAMLAEPLPRFDASAAVPVGNADDLARLKPAFVSCLSEAFGLAHLAGRFMPVMLDNNTVAVFALSDQVGADQVDALSAEIVARGYALAQPSRYVLPAPLLLALARGQVCAKAAGPSVSSSSLVSRTALAEAFHDLVCWAVRNQASDIHLNVLSGQTESEVKYTVAGRYITPERFRRMPTSTLLEMLAVAWMDIQGGNGAVFDPFVEQQGSMVRQVDGRSILLRWSSLACDAGPSVCFRVLHQHHASDLPGLLQLGYLPDQVQLIERVMRSEGGVVIFAGNVGSGKSTSLASLMAALPAERKLVTIEDPVEYLIPGAVQNSLSRNLDQEAHEMFASKLRALKRSGMNDVLLGEIRDAETGRAFMDLAGSGVSLFTTVHAPSAKLIVQRLTSDFIRVSRDFLAMPGLFRLRAYQALLPALCLQCATPVKSICKSNFTLDTAGLRTTAWLDTIAHVYQQDPSVMRVRNQAGCAACRHADTPLLNGYAGRTLAAELIEHDLELHMQRSAMGAAVIKAFQAMVDPRDIEARFHAIETERVMRTDQQRDRPTGMSTLKGPARIPL